MTPDTDMTPDLTPEATPDEQRDAELTAFALNELDANRRAAVEARLADDPELREQAAEVRRDADALRAAFATEPLPATKEDSVLRTSWVHRGLAVAACLTLTGVTASLMLPQMSRIDPTLRSELMANAKRTTPNALSTGPGRDEKGEVAGDPGGVRGTTYLGIALQEPAPSGLVDVDGDGLTDSRLNQHAWLESKNTAAITLNGITTGQPEGESGFWSSPNHGDWRGGDVRNDNSTGFEIEASTRLGTALYADSPSPETAAAYEGWYRGGDVPYPGNRPAGDQRFRPRFDDSRLGRLPQAQQGRSYFEAPGSTDSSRYEDFAFAGEANSSETYAPLVDNPFRSPADAPLSTFSIDVDTASYANVRRMLTDGQLPPADAVRIEEFVNSFDYGYAPPAPDADAPFATHVAVASAPWAPEHRLVRIGLKGKEIATDDRPAANLVFLLDVSGSMNKPKKLPLVKDGLRKLVAALRMDDRIAIVVYAGASGLVVDSTTDHDAVLAAIENLTPGGSTHASAGIELAYDVATANFIDGGLNRVILCTDGDFNVGITDRSTLKTLIEAKAATGTYLSILGFGTGNLKDATMEELSNAGDGNYGYIDSPKEAEKLLARQVNGTLLTIAKDVKIQVEFNPAKVASYRLIGYANRMLKKEDFNNDTVDAGDIGSGHTVTALYEVVPMGVAGPVPAVDPLKYAAPAAIPAAAGHDSDELLTVKLRYKAPDAPKEQGTSQLLTVPVVDADQGLDDADADFQFAAAAAGLGMVLRDSDHAGDLNLAQVAQMARGANARFHGADQERAAREAFVELVNRAAAISAETDDQRP